MAFIGESISVADRFGNFTAIVNGHLTGRAQPCDRSSYRSMENLQEILGRIDERRAQLKKAGQPHSDSAISVKAGLSSSAIRNMRRAVQKGSTRKGVTTRTISRLAGALEVNAGWLLNNEGDPDSLADDADAPTQRMVQLVGYVGAGAEAHFYAIADENLDEVPAPEWATDHTKAVEIRGNSLGSLFDRWLVFFDDVRSPVTPDLLGELCVVGLPDDRVLIKKIKRAKGGLYDLLSDDKREDPIEGVAVMWAAKVKNMVPR